MSLPGFTPGVYNIIRHIHLGAVPYDGSAPTGFLSHGEPPYQVGAPGLGAVIGRTPVFSGMSDFVRAWDGTPFDHTIRINTNVSPITFVGLQYRLRVDQATLDILQALLRRRVYLVDTRHCLDNVDHTPYVKQYFFNDLSYDENLDPLLNHNLVTATFEDMYTVAGL